MGIHKQRQRGQRTDSVCRVFNFVEVFLILKDRNETKRIEVIGSSKENTVCMCECQTGALHANATQLMFININKNSFNSVLACSFFAGTQCCSLGWLKHLNTDTDEMCIKCLKPPDTPKCGQRTHTHTHGAAERLNGEWKIKNTKTKLRKKNTQQRYIKQNKDVRAI